MRPVDLFDYAERLLGTADSEAAHRNVVGRLYYAVYHLAWQRALADGFVPKNTGDDHGRQMRHFAAHPDVRLRPLGRRLLPQLRTLRNKADWATDVFALLDGR